MTKKTGPKQFLTDMSNMSLHIIILNIAKSLIIIKYFDIKQLTNWTDLKALIIRFL